MIICKKCGSALIRAACYDPDGLVPLLGGQHIGDGDWWVCTNPDCPEGKENLGRS